MGRPEKNKTRNNILIPPALSPFHWVCGFHSIFYCALSGLMGFCFIHPGLWPGLLYVALSGLKDAAPRNHLVNERYASRGSSVAPNQLRSFRASSVKDEKFVVCFHI